MSVSISGSSINVSYTGARVLDPVKKEDQAELSQVKNDGTTTDNVLDLSDISKLPDELTQDVASIKIVKIGDKFISAPDIQTLTTLIKDIREAALETGSSNKLKENFKYIEFKSSTGIKSEPTVSIENIDESTETNLTDNPDISLPESALFARNGLSNAKYNIAYSNVGSKDSKNIFVKAQNDIQAKIQDIDNKILTLPEGSPEKEKLEHLKSAYSSVKDIYQSFSTPLHPTAKQLNNLQKQLDKADQLIGGIADKFSEEEIQANSEGIKDLVGTVENFKLIAHGFLKDGGKSESAANNINQFALQAFQRLADPNRKIPLTDGKRTMAGALKTFGMDVSDMKVYVSKLSEILKKVESGQLSRSQADAAVRNVGSQASNNFQGDIRNVVSAASDAEEAENQVEAGRARVATAQSDLDNADGQVVSGNASATQAQNGVTTTQANLRQKNSSGAITTLGTATVNNEDARTSARTARTSVASANSNLSGARGNARNAQGLVASGQSKIGTVTGGRFGKELSGVTGQVNGSLTSVQPSITNLNGSITTTQDRAVRTERSVSDLDARVTTNETEIVATENTAIKMEEDRIAAERAKDKNGTSMIDGLLKNTGYGSFVKVDIMGDIGVGVSNNLIAARVAVGLQAGITAEKTFGQGRSYLVHVDIEALVNAEAKLKGVFEANVTLAAGLSKGLAFKTPEDARKFVNELGEFLTRISDPVKYSPSEMESSFNKLSTTVSENKYSATTTRASFSAELKRGAELGIALERTTTSGTFADGQQVDDETIKGEGEFELPGEMGKLKIEVGQDNSFLMRDAGGGNPSVQDKNAKYSRTFVAVEIPTELLQAAAVKGIGKLPPKLLEAYASQMSRMGNSFSVPEVKALLAQALGSGKLSSAITSAKVSRSSGVVIELERVREGNKTYDAVSAGISSSYEVKTGSIPVGGVVSVSGRLSASAKLLQIVYKTDKREDGTISTGK